MIKRWMLALSFVLAAAFWLPGTAGYADQKFEDGIDRPGSDINRQEFPSNYNQITCQNLCEQNGQCNSWTYVRPGVQGPKGVCYQKAGLPGPTPNNCCISGVVFRTTEPNIDRPGLDYSKQVTGDDPAQCQSNCAGDRRCSAWTHVKAGVQGSTPFCYLKSDVPDAQPNGCCTSGVKDALGKF